MSLHASTPHDSDRRAPRWGPSRTPRTASGGSLRFGPRRLYPHRGPRLAGLAGDTAGVLNPNRTRLKTIHH